jgi:aminomethyltransferase
VAAGAYEVVRIEAGVPTMGAELTERTIPAEAGIVERTVSFTKGCFTGQELVARIDSRAGKVPRHLRGVVLADAAAPAGAALMLDGQQVGQLTSAAATPNGGAVALAYVKRGVEVPVDALATWGNDLSAASVRALPLVA